MAAKDWFGIFTRLKLRMSGLAGDSPRVMNSFRSLAQDATESGELDAKNQGADCSAHRHNGAL
jgi:hypothetical protein